MRYVTINNINPDDETKVALARAFDVAWTRFIELEGAEAATEDNRKRLAARIVALAKSGETDEQKQSETALIYLRVLAEAARLGARNRNVTALRAELPFDEHGYSFAPETVTAMTTALNLCLDELPLRIPSNALKLLSASILDAASRGERDPHRLHLHALKALKAR
ncbi:MAG: hypothetical protein JSS22_23830 [Proteobacteria bacterium]|nr:hypothetical protein [Pseudomonadota bacterium]